MCDRACCATFRQGILLIAYLQAPLPQIHTSTLKTRLPGFPTSSPRSEKTKRCCAQLFLPTVVECLRFTAQPTNQVLYFVSICLTQTASFCATSYRPIFRVCFQKP